MEVLDDAYAGKTLGLPMGAAEIAKSLVGVEDAAIMRCKVVELCAQILAAQSSALSANLDLCSLLLRLRNLEDEVSELKASFGYRQKPMSAVRKDSSSKQQRALSQFVSAIQPGE